MKLLGAQLPKKQCIDIQGGQAMVLTILFAGVSVLIMLLMFNSGMLANAKTRLQNAADAGAYSAAVLQARDHNFSAYTNRAMVANQVAVVQLASLKSYLDDASATHRRMGESILRSQANDFPTVKPNWDIAESIPIENVAQTFDQVAPAAVTGLDRIILALEFAQESHHTSTDVNMIAIAAEIVKKNDPESRLTTGSFAGHTAYMIDSWSDSGKRHRANDSSVAADRFADVAVSEQSTDQFTRKRDSRPLPAWSAEVKSCTTMPFYFYSFTQFKFNHGGGSMLSADKKRWLALDATMGEGFWICHFNVPCPVGTCPFFLRGPLFDGEGGSGGALVGADGGYDSKTGYAGNPSTSDYFGGALNNPQTSVPANARYRNGPGSTLDAAGGLQNYYRDMANPTSNIPVNQSATENGAQFAVTIEVERKQSSVRTSSKLLGGADRIKLDDAMQADSMRVLSSAHAYFYRANSDAGFNQAGWQRADGKTELANMFNPYWQPRLIDRSESDRSISWGAQQ